MELAEEVGAAAAGAWIRLLVVRPPTADAGLGGGFHVTTEVCNELIWVQWRGCVGWSAKRLLCGTDEFYLDEMCWKLRSRFQTDWRAGVYSTDKCYALAEYVLALVQFGDKPVKAKGK